MIFNGYGTSSMMATRRVFYHTLVIWIFGLVTYVVSAGPCHFPVPWQGQWYQSGIGDITIAHNSITRKGICRDKHRDYYLLENIEEHCHQCLLVLPRDHNILQYKTSYCIGRDSLQSICAQITVEAVLHTLIREPSYPVPCPMQSAFYVTYNNNSGGFCRNPTSYLHQCASTNLFHFTFYKCQYSAYTSERELDFRCLATWKDGSDLFLYGVFTGSDVIFKEQSYRCFMYTVLGTVAYMAMSADATCQGLRSPQDGPMVMELTQDVYGWPRSDCIYPQWFVERDWRDLSGRHQYIIESGGTSITTSYQSANNNTVLQSSYHCLSSKHFNDSGREAFSALVHVLDHCHTQFRCIKIRHVDLEMTEIYLGDYVIDRKSRCTDAHFKSATYRILIPSDLRPVECPYPGLHISYRRDVYNCYKELHSSCDGTTSLEVISSCHDKPVFELECLSWWDMDGKRILLAEDINSGMVNCFSLVIRDNELVLTTDQTYNVGVTQLMVQKMVFKLSASGSCTHSTPSPGVRGVKHINELPGDDPGGGYNLVEQPTPPTTRNEFVQQTSGYKRLSSAGVRYCNTHYVVPTIVCMFTVFRLGS